MPRPSLTDSILAVDADTFLPLPSMQSSSYRMEIYRRASKVMSKLDLPLNLDRMRLIVVYSEVAMRLGTSVTNAVAYIIHLALAENIEPSPERALSAYCLVWCKQIHDEDRKAALCSAQAEEDA